MKKRSIVLLSILMAITFFGLLFLQLNYLGSFLDMRQQHFNEAVKRSLYQLSRTLEEEETLSYLNDALSKEEKQNKESLIKEEVLETSSIFSISDGKNGNTTTIHHRISISSANKTNSVQEISENLQNRLKQNYARKKIVLNDIAMQWLKESTEKPIEKRVNFKHMEEGLKKELENNGINTPFYIVLIDYTGKEVYRSPDFQKTNNNFYYSQLLFPNDYNPKMNFVRAYFPEANQYLAESVSFMAFSSILFTIILFLVFVATLILIVRQKRLGEIKTDFMNNMTHEFKTPISSISLASQMLQDEGIVKTPEILRNISKIIYDETKRLSFQVEKVLQIAILEKEKSIMKFKDTDINELIESVANNFSLKVTSKGGSIFTELQAEDCWATVDEMHFTNVIFNLLDNAVKYSKPNEDLTLTLKTWNEKEWLYISVEDNGIGIKKEHLKKIFDRFHRVPTGNVHNVKGFGLGLAYVKKIVEKHKGHIHAESEINVGTKFIISIPTLKK